MSPGSWENGEWWPAENEKLRVWTQVHFWKPRRPSSSWACQAVWSRKSLGWHIKQQKDHHCKRRPSHWEGWKPFTTAVKGTALVNEFIFLSASSENPWAEEQALCPEDTYPRLSPRLKHAHFSHASLHPLTITVNLLPVPPKYEDYLSKPIPTPVPPLKLKLQESWGNKFCLTAWCSFVHCWLHTLVFFFSLLKE